MFEIRFKVKFKFYIYIYIYIYIYKSKKTTSYFHRTFRIALNSFSTVKPLNSATAFTKKLKVETTIESIFIYQSWTFDFAFFITSHNIFVSVTESLRIPISKMKCILMTPYRSTFNFL